MKDRDRLIELLKEQALYGFPPACNWVSEDGAPCVFDRHENGPHVTYRPEPTVRQAEMLLTGQEP